MSRILLMNDDDRQVPHTACWWRLRLYRNADGFYYTQQLHVGEDWTPDSHIPWSGHIDYYDGRNDWTWPYKAHIYVDEQIPEIGRGRTVIPNRKYFLDILDVVPPHLPSSYDPRQQWFRLTRSSTYNPRGEFYVG
ncbi:hypothetical protein SEA_REINDEER_89 [Mycobacterium phage Reindeer]|uniref:Uncharacterized protein n=1 Tax=Mycobacterium phage Reindeer TaxID=2762283 RepID=A0A7G8LI27_9CAUD|nr:hypothetical protein J4U05_gp089 [Mycobacterium phage Reindeer]QNJ56899.1 hypothetical protein SEA_REINDEER_89 [Mycobacterium phage Reindeer]